MSSVIGSGCIVSESDRSVDWEVVVERISRCGLYSFGKQPSGAETHRLHNSTIAGAELDEDEEPETEEDEAK